MNLKKYIYALALPVMVLCACDSDLDKAIYNPDQNVPAVLESVDASYALNMDDAEKTAIEFKWKKPEVNYEAAITTQLQMDVKGKNFTGAGVQIVISTMVDNSYPVKTSDLNSLILKMLDAYEMEIDPVEVEFRLSSAIAESTSSFISNVISTTITPYITEINYPSIALRGDYNGWDFDKSQKVYSAESNNNYAGMVYFDGKAANGWKFCEDANWTTNWGVGEDATNEQSPITLVASGGDIKIYSHKSYYLEFDKVTGVLKTSKVHDSWGIVGGHNSWGAGDTVMTLADEVDKSGKTQYFLVATLDMPAGNEWKIRPDETWSDEVGPSAVEGDFIDNGNGNFRVDDAGNYTIKWYFNKVKQQVIVIKN